MAASDRFHPERQERSRNFCSGQGARHKRTAASDEATQGLGFRLPHDQLHQSG